MTDFSKFSSISFNQVVKPQAAQQPQVAQRPQAAQRVEVRTKNSVVDKENVNASPPVCLKVFIQLKYI